MAGRRIEIEFVDDVPGGRLRVIVNGQICGPSIAGSRVVSDLDRDRLQQVFQLVFERGIAIGVSETQQKMKAVLGL